MIAAAAAQALRSVPGLERISSSGRTNTETIVPLRPSGNKSNLSTIFRFRVIAGRESCDSAPTGGLAGRNRRLYVKFGRKGGRQRHGAVNAAVVTLERIGKSYATRTEVLREISLALEPGGFYFLTGAGGSGKSTLLRLICLAEPPSRGTVRLFGADTSALDRGARAGLRRRIGVVFQDFRLLDDLSVSDNIALPLRIAGTPESEVRERSAALLDWLGLREHGDARPSVLTAGDRQRVAIARAIVARPDLLIGDEPTEHVDRDSASLLVRVFERINRLGTTVLIASRDLGFAARFPYPRFHLECGSLQIADGIAS